VAEPVFMKAGMYIMAPEPISKAYFINPSHRSLCLCVYPFYLCYAKAQYSISFIPLPGNGSVNMFQRKRIYTTIEELLDACDSGVFCVSPYRC
jgi:hypothetical protein